MVFQRQENLGEAKDWFARLDLEFQATTALRHLSGNIEAENIFRDLLNLLFDWSLSNANWSGAINQDALDLEDRLARIAVQVTTTMSAAKIRKTLENFIPNHSKNFDRLIFIYPRMTKSSSSADFSKQLCGFGFTPGKDRYDLSDLLLEIQNCTIFKQDAVLNLLRNELKPLGAALCLGVDQNVEVIISIIRYISDVNTTVVVLPELKPDAFAKIARFQEHGGYLKRQFAGNVQCYRAVDEARHAVGYDGVRAARCAAWLKDRSLAALEDNGGDARKAFDSLVEHLCRREREAGRDCEENAVRYFLADEIGRCNVFPNPSPTFL